MMYQQLQEQLHAVCKVEETLALASQIWLAGIGALARAQQEGRAFFDELVQCGEVMEAVDNDSLKDLKRLARHVLANSESKVGPADAPTLEEIQNLAEAIRNFDLHMPEMEIR